MRVVFAAIALCVCALARPALGDDAAPAVAASFYGELTQVPLTENQVWNYIASMPDMRAAMGDAPADAPEPDAATMAKVEAVAKKYGFRDFNDYNTVAGNIQLVLDGVDPETRAYVGAETVVTKTIAKAKADATMTAADRQAALAELQLQLKSATPVKIPSNIALVVKNYAKLNAD